MKGDLEMETSDLDDAFEDYQKLWLLAPESGYVLSPLPDITEKTNQMDEAEKCLFKIFEAKKTLLFPISLDFSKIFFLL